MIPGMREAVLRDYCGNVALFGFCAKLNLEATKYKYCLSTTEKLAVGAY